MMMRRLLVLMLVLGIASAASAATVAVYTNVTQGGIDALTAINAPGDAIQITISENVGIAGGTAGFTVGLEDTMGPTGTLPAGAWLLAPLVTNNPQDVTLGVGTAAFPPAPRAYLVVDFVIGPGAFGGDGDLDITYTGMLVGGTPAAAALVPEPITIALLGLGGLFLRRRK